jgi:hypothetical protein
MEDDYAAQLCKGFGAPGGGLPSIGDRPSATPCCKQERVQEWAGERGWWG